MGLVVSAAAGLVVGNSVLGAVGKDASLIPVFPVTLALA